jgi:hypothetical protein
MQTVAPCPSPVHSLAPKRPKLAILDGDWDPARDAIAERVGDAVKSGGDLRPLLDEVLDLLKFRNRRGR